MKNQLFRAVIAVAIGLVLIFNPQGAFRTIIYAVGLALVVYGIYLVINAHRVAKNLPGAIEDQDGKGKVLPDKSFWKNLHKRPGLYITLAGLLFCLFPGFFVSLSTFVLGVFLLILGISQMVPLFKSHQMGGKTDWSGWLAPVLAIVLGTALLFGPAKVGWMAGVACIVYGATELLAAVRAKSA